MGLKVEETDALADDLFSAAFDEEVKGVVEPEAKVDEVVEPAPEVKEEAEVEVKAPEVDVVKVESPAPIDIKAVIAETIAATKVVEPKVETPAVPSAEELAAEEQYRKDWPEHAAREDRLRAQLEEVKNLLSETTKALQGQIAPAVEAANLTAEERHYNTILTAHPDAEKIVPDVEAWIAKQPKFIQPHYNSVLEQGSAVDVVELFSLFKSANPAQQVVDTNAQQAADAEAQAKADRLKRMATPTSIRTSVTAEEDASDFDSAFDSEAKKYKVAA